MLCRPADWRACEVVTLPAPDGPCYLGIDLGGSASMTAAVAYWPQTGRFETSAAFPGEPGLMIRGAADGVGELKTYPEQCARAVHCAGGP